MLNANVTVLKNKAVIKLATISILPGSVGLIDNAVSPQAMFIIAIVLMISAIILLALNIKKDIKGWFFKALLAKTMFFY